MNVSSVLTRAARRPSKRHTATMSDTSDRHQWLHDTFSDCHHYHRRTTSAAAVAPIHTCTLLLQTNQ